MDSLTNANTLNVELTLGQVLYVIPETGVCIVQPLTSAIGRKGDTATLSGVGSLARAAVKDSTIYRIGEYVLYARVTADSFHASSPMEPAIILCRAPVFIFNHEDITDVRENLNGDFHNFYDLITQLVDRKDTPDSPSAEFITRSWIETRMGGDRVLEGRNTLLRVSDELIQILGRRCGIHINSVDSSVELHGITQSQSFIGKTTRSIIANDTVTHIEGTAGGVDSAYNKQTETEKSMRETVEGDLAYGKVSTLFSDTGVPLSQEQHRHNGEQFFKSATGFLFEKTTAIDAYRPAVGRSILHDPNIREVGGLPGEYREPFDRITESKNWKAANGDKNEQDYVRKPGDGNDSEKTATDAEGYPVPVFEGKASWGVLPNGGFVIRDAWGSEIRMCDGDIQISAARHLKYITGQDQVGIVGGVSSLQAGKGIAAGTTTGNIDVSAASEFIAHSKASLKLCSDLQIDVLAEQDIKLKSVTGGVAASGVNMGLVAEEELSISGAKTYVTGSSDALLASPAAAVRCTGTLSMGSADIRVFGDLRMSDNEYAIGEINGIKIKCGRGAGNITTPGSVYVDNYVGVNTGLTVRGAGYFGSLSTADAQKVEGGYGFSGKLKSAPSKVGISNPATGSGVTANYIPKLLAGVAGMTKSTVLDMLFKFKESMVAFIRPIFCDKHENKAKISSPTTVDIQGKKRYIYPGEVFWTSKGVQTINNLNTAKNVLQEQVDSAPTQGAAELKLN